MPVSSIDQLKNLLSLVFDERALCAASWPIFITIRIWLKPQMVPNKKMMAPENLSEISKP